MAAHNPIALARRAGSVKMLVISPSVVGKMTAASTPIAARVAMSWSAEFTCSATPEGIANSARPAMSQP